MKYFLAGCLFFGWLAGGTFAAEGLTVQDSVVLRNGEPYRAMGINYNNCFSLLLADADNRDFVDGFRLLKEEYNIPYIRFMAGPFGHRGWNLYAEDADEYFRRMDLLVREAEKRDLGLIPSLFWSVVAVPDFMDEPLSALGDKDSRSRAFIRQYTTDFVERYKDSPAIYGWELGNEYLLAADLPGYDHLPSKKMGTDQPRTKADKLTRPMLLDLYTDFYQTVRALDADRIIVTGDSIPRAFAWHNRNEDSWGKDTEAQWLERFEADTPSCYEMVSFHLYEEAEGAYFKGQDVPIESVVRAVVERCRQQNKPIWCGELGMPGTDEKARDIFVRMMKSIEENQIDLSAIWNFVPTGKYQSAWDILPQGERSYMLDAVRELNERFAIPAISKGLTVEDGLFMKDGKPFKGVGINFFDALTRRTGFEGDPPTASESSTREGFETLRRYEIPFVRFCAGGFFPKNWNLYKTDKEAYFKIFDQLILDAEACGIGLVPSLFWHFPTVPDLVGESVDQWGNPESKTHEFMRRYTTEVVSRYKDSPAIWGWEFGNEYIHESDIPQLEMGRGMTVPKFGTPTARTARDKMYRKNVWVAYQAFAETVRALDPTRPIFSGDAMPRPSAFHNWTEAAWKVDSQEEWRSIFLKDNAAMDALSVHFYYYSKEDRHRDGGVLAFDPGQQFEFMMGIARDSKKPLFIGEFGPNGTEKTPVEEQRQFEELLGLIVQHEVPLSALWNFDFEHKNQGAWNITETNHRAYMLDALQKANQKLKK